MSEPRTDPVATLRGVPPKDNAGRIRFRSANAPAPPACAKSGTPETTGDAEEAAVLDVVVSQALGRSPDSFVTSEGAPTEQPSDADLAALAAQVPCLSTDAIRSYFAKNVSTDPLASLAQARPSWRFVAAGTRMTARAFVGLSRVGFSPDGRQAFVKASYRSGPRGGGGSYYVLQKMTQGWVVLYRAPLWLS